MSTTTTRHATIAEITAQVQTRVAALQLLGVNIFATGAVTVLPVSDYKAVLQRIDAMTLFPACLILAGNGTYRAGASAQRIRELDIACFVIGDYSAATDAATATVWNIADRISRSFLPTPTTVVTGPVTIDSVRYAPSDIQQISIGPDRACIALKLATTDPMAARSDLDSAPPVTP